MHMTIDITSMTLGQSYVLFYGTRREEYDYRITSNSLNQKTGFSTSSKSRCNTGVFPQIE